MMVSLASNTTGTCSTLQSHANNINSSICLYYLQLMCKISDTQTAAMVITEQSNQASLVAQLGHASYITGILKSHIRMLNSDVYTMTKDVELLRTWF